MVSKSRKKGALRAPASAGRGGPASHVRRRFGPNWEQKNFPFINQPGPWPEKNFRIFSFINPARGREKVLRNRFRINQNSFLLSTWPEVEKNCLAEEFFAETPCMIDYDRMPPPSQGGIRPCACPLRMRHPSMAASDLLLVPLGYASRPERPQT